MTGTLLSTAAATFDTAEICGTPTPATMRVVQMDRADADLDAVDAGFTRSRARVDWSQRSADDCRSPTSPDARDHVEHAWNAHGPVSTTTTSTPASRSAARARACRAPYLPPRHAQAPERSCRRAEFGGFLEIRSR